MVSNGADTELKTWRGETPLMIATQYGHRDVVNYLKMTPVEREIAATAVKKKEEEEQ